MMPSLVTNMGSTLWLWVMMILVLVEGWSSFGCLEQERVALLQLKANINYPNGTYLSSWAPEEITNCCEWEGVECNSTTNRVTQLSLNDTRVYPSNLGYWYFNASLFLPFEELRTLQLRRNGLAGWVENEGFKCLSRLSNLEVLDLSHNYLNNSVLSSLSGLSSLKYLFVQWNHLEGSTHINSFERLRGLSNLEVLDLSYDQLNGSIHSFLELDDFTSLKELNLSYNRIESFEPISGLKRETRLKNLEVLDLSGNEFSNDIWSALSGFSSLKTLNLGDNKLNGTIHTQGLKRETRLKNLEVLDLSENEFSNDIWSALSGFSSLKTLNLRLNKLNGTNHTQELGNWSTLENLFLDYSSPDIDFLASIRVMTSLQVLSMRECGLTGRLPTQGLCELKTLRELDLWRNEFSGNLPWCLGNLTSLQLLDISYNDFTGNVALSPLVSLTSLEYLVVSYNRFEIPISFKSFFNHSKLKFIESLNNKLLVEEDFPALGPSFQLIGIRLSNSEHGNLSKAFPHFLYHQWNLRKAELSRIDFRGEFPNWLLENNTRMVSLLLPNSLLYGPLTLPLRPVTELLELDISNNLLHGCIPYNIGSLFPSLKFLNMSTNAFEGDIPSSLGDMTSLDTLDLSNNRLSGEIPVHLAMRCYSLSHLILSNNNLKGPILPPQNNLTMLGVFNSGPQ